jgi:hypothetical protein
VQGKTAARIFGALVGGPLLAVAIALSLTGVGARGADSPTERTSFGVFRVEHAERVPMARVKFGNVHDPIGPHKVQVEIAAVVENRLDRPVIFSPGQFRLRLDKRGVTIASVEGTATATGTLGPGERVRTRLTFIAPRHAAGMSLEFHDLGLARRPTLELGRIPLAGRTADLTVTHNHSTGG